MRSAHTTFAEVLEAWVLARPREPAYVFIEEDGSEQTLSVIELWSRARALASALSDRARRNDRLLLLYPPGLEYCIALWACLLAGATAVPAYPPDPTRLDRTLERLSAIAADSKAAAVLSIGAFVDLKDALGPSSLRTLDWMATDRPLSSERDPALPRPDACALVQYTSGSTRVPRGVVLTQANILANLHAYRSFIADGTDGVTLMWLPIYHDMGLMGGLLASAYAGTPCVFMSPVGFIRRPARWLEAITRHRATHSGGPNFGFELCLKHVSAADRDRLDLSSWRRAPVGAEPTRAETIAEFARIFEPCGFRRDAFRACYGLAESVLFVAGGPAWTAQDPRWISHGTAPADHEIAVVDPSTCDRKADGEEGEIWVRGPSVGSGYLGHDEDTRATFEARQSDGSGPFLRTGDLGFTSASELFISGRLKDLVILRGRNLLAHDLEHTVERSHRLVRPGCCAAFSIDTDREEQLAIVAEAAIDDPGELESAEIAVTQALAAEYDVSPDVVTWVRRGTLFKTSSGKLQRGRIKEALLRGELDCLRSYEASTPVERPAPPAHGSQHAIADWLAGWIAALLGREARTIPRSVPLTEVGLDSLALANLMFDLEQWLGVTLPATFTFGLPTIELIAQTLASQRPSEGGSHAE